MVASSVGIEFDFDQLQPPVVRENKLGDVLEPIALDDPRWTPMQGLKDKEIRDIAAGKGFKMQTFGAEASSIGTVTKGYGKVRSTDPKVKHPTDHNLLRQLTPVEHARVKQVPDHLVAGLCSTTAHEVLGQGIVYSPFKGVGALVGDALNSFMGRPRVGAPSIKLIDVSVADVEVNTATVELVVGVEDSLVGVQRGLDFLDEVVHHGSYSGMVLGVADGVVTQRISRAGETVQHELAALSVAVAKGDVVDISYADGVGVVGGKGVGLGVGR